MSITNGQVLKAFIEFRYPDGTLAQNVFHFLADFIADQQDADVVDAIESYVEDIYGSISTYLADDFTINPGYVYILGWSVPLQKWIIDALVGTFTPSFTHTNTDDGLPNNACPTMTAHTSRPGSMGRKFLMGVVETIANYSNIVAGGQTALATAVGHYIADETISTNNELIVGVPSTVTGEFEPFTDGEASIYIGSQRRRKPKVGT